MDSNTEPPPLEHTYSVMDNSIGGEEDIIYTVPTTPFMNNNNNNSNKIIGSINNNNFNNNKIIGRLNNNANNLNNNNNNNNSRFLSTDSGCTSPTAEDALLLNHDYADPIEIKEGIKLEMQKIDRHKRQNLVYEPVTTAKAKKKDKNFENVRSGAGGERVCKCTTQTLCLMFVFVVSSSSLALCLLITFGILDVDGSPVLGKYLIGFL